MKNEWINIDKLGTVGIEPDRVQVGTEPQSFTEAVNIRAIGPNISNAGGYKFIVGEPVTTFPIGPVFVTQFLPEEVRITNDGIKVSQYTVEEIRIPSLYPILVTQFAVLEIRQSNEYG